jgi:hypothetical protein
LAGATVLRGMEGFGASQVVRTTRLVSLSDDLPLVIVIVDTAARIEAFLPVLDELLDSGLVTSEELDVVVYGLARPAERGWVAVVSAPGRAPPRRPAAPHDRAHAVHPPPRHRPPRR